MYNNLFTQGQVSFQLYDDQIEKIDSVVKTVYSSYFGVTRFPSNEERAAAYYCLIIKDHVVTDENKRLATLWLEVYCNALNLPLDTSIPPDELAVSVEADKRLPIAELIAIVARILF